MRPPPPSGTLLRLMHLARSLGPLLLLPLLAAPLAGCDEHDGAAPAAPPSTASAPVQSAALHTTEPPPAAPAPSAAEAPDWITAQHLLVAYKGAKDAAKSVKRSKADAKKRAEEARDKAKKGDDFTKLVAEYSDDPGAAMTRGNLGKFTRTSMVKAFSDAAFALPVNGISDVVETEYGFHVIKRNQ